MALPTTSLSSLTDDEEIIDLTDIVEKGSVPEGMGSVQSDEHSLESQMADLLNSGGKEAEGFDLDALLKESGLDVDAVAGESDPTNGVKSVSFDAPDIDIFPEEAPSTGKGQHSVAPEEMPTGLTSPITASHKEESEDMLDMGDVDALVRDLLPPEQPSTGGVSGKTARVAPDADVDTEEVGEDELDSLLASFDTAPGNSLAGDEDDDLDSLLNSIMNSDAEKSSANQTVKRSAPAMVEGDELDDLLKAAMVEETPAVEVGPSSAPSSVPEGEPEGGTKDEPKDDDDFDALMKSILSGTDAPVEKATLSVSGNEEADDFDDLMKSLVEADSPPSEDVSLPSTDVADDDLDMLLNSVLPNAEKQIFGDDASPEVKTVKAGIDALLSSVQADMEAQAKPINPKIAEASLDELDALIAGLETEEEARPEVTPKEREEAMSTLLEALGSPADPLDKGESGMVDGQGNSKQATQVNENNDFAAALAAEMTTQKAEPLADLSTGLSENLFIGASADGVQDLDVFSSVGEKGGHEFAVGGSLNDLEQILANVVASQSGIHSPGNTAELEDFPLESDLGDPLLVDETPFVTDSEDGESDLGAAVLQSLESLAIEIAGLQDRMESFSVVGTAQDSVVLLQTQMEHIQAEVRDISEGHSEGLAAAEARVSILEAELAERAAGESDLVPHLEQRIAMLETSLLNFEKGMIRYGEMLADAEGRILNFEAKLADRPSADLEARLNALETGFAARAALDEEETDKPDVAGDVARLVDRVESLEIGVKNTGRFEERIVALETGVDKAAAEAAARVIREELAALLSDMETTDEE